MSERNISISQRENYTPSPFTEFLWWLSTAEKELLSECVVDRNRFRIIGMTVLTTWAFATLAWTYFFSTIINHVFVYIMLGAFMGFVILTIDRALIKGITKFNKNKFTPLLLRAFLALTIGVFMAQPALLFMFDKEIKLQTSLDNEKKKIQKRDELNTLYHTRKEELDQQKQSLQTELSKKYEDVSKARENYIAEADGSGGTGRIGIKEIALAKKKEYEKLEGEYRDLLAADQPKILNTEKEIATIDEDIKKEELLFTNYFNDGFLTRIEALNNLVKSNAALQFRYYLLVVILMLIELMPVIAKTLLPSGTYDEKVRLREEMETTIARSNITKEQELKELYNAIAKTNDEEAITAFFSITKDHKNEKIKAFSQKWSAENHETFDGLWGKMKREILSKQEN
jgi:Na+-dependent transporters of the SNF family